MKKIILFLIFVFAVLIGCPNDTTGSEGKDGADGASIVWKGSYASADDNALANPQYLWAFYNTTDGCSYLWNGTEWTLLSGKHEAAFDIPWVNLTEDDYTKVYIRTVDSTGDVVNAGSCPMFFLDTDEQKENPYISVITANIAAFVSSDYKVSDVSADTTQVIITNTKRNTRAIIDLSKHICKFENYDLFFQTSDEVYLDIAMPKLEYIQIIDSANIAGQPISLDWTTQDIEMVLVNDDGEYCLAMPLQTFNDIFLAASNYSLVYNGQYLYYSSNIRSSSKIKNDYYSTATIPSQRSESFAKFCYNEFCLNLDFHYGLKSIHGIDSFPDFDTYFKCVGIKDQLSSTDSLTFAKAVKDVCEFYFGDGHSNYMLNSCYLGQNVAVTANHTSAMSKEYQTHLKRYDTARNAQYNSSDNNKKVPGYEVSADGKTAIVRFDSFTSHGGTEKTCAIIKSLASLLTDEMLNVYTDYLENESTTITFIHKVNEKIKADSNIENVVLDLSCNGGGSCHSAAFVLSWMLGEATLNLSNPITGAKWFGTYQADVNMNGTFDETGDTIKDKNLYCLISPLSFSCGNMVPAVLKASDRVTMLGAKSSGGTSVVQHSSTADGTQFRMSSKYVMSVAKNGSAYDIDQGIEPHYYISKPKDLYDIETLVKLLK
ncbi:MAG: hypothetical protein II707_01420 [Spirochaetales bacterium]|nr:hypothetical protein [Spirochaetales bacterium]